MAVVNQSKMLLPLVEEYWELWCEMGMSDDDRRLGILRTFAEAWDNQTPKRARNSLDAGFVTKWLAQAGAGKADKSRKKYAGFVRRFLEWGIINGLPWQNTLMFNPGKKGGAERDKDPIWLDMKFIRDLWMRQDHWYWRGAIALTTLMLRRQGEMITLKLDQINMRQRTIRYDNHKVGRKGQTVKFTPWLFEELETHLIAYANQWCRQQGITPVRPIESWQDARKYLPGYFYLIPRTHNNWGKYLEIFPEEKRLTPLTQQMHRRIVAAMPKGAETLGIGAHTLRRSAARAMYLHMIKTDPGAKEWVSEALGHTNTRTTDIYLCMTDRQINANNAIAAMDGWGIEDDETPDDGGKVIPLRATS